MTTTACGDPLQALASRPTAAPSKGAAQPKKNSYTDILRSSAWIGGSSVICIVFNVVRTKVMALLLGPGGVGLLGLFSSISDLTRSIAEMGINSSGVRQIAESVGTGDRARIARTVTVLRRVSVILGSIGAAILLLGCGVASKVTFGSTQRAGTIALLSLSVLFTLVSDGQGALVQGMRRISDLARMKVWGALFGCVLSIPIVYFLREDGIVLSLVAVAGMSIGTSWWYSRKVKIDPPQLSAGQVAHEVSGLLRIGAAFMASSLMMMGVAYFVRVTVFRRLGYEAAGLYQSAWTLAGIYAGLILQALGADFYPRLTGVAGDNAVCNRMVNEQALVSLLLAGPGILATLTFAPTVMTLFYSHRFAAAADVLQWICLGMTLRVIIWPIGFIIVARGAAKLFFLTDFVWTVVNVGAISVCVRVFGLKGAGMAFFASYVVNGFLVYAIVRRMSGFRWTSQNRTTGLLLLFSVGVVFCGFHVLPHPTATALGLVATLAGGFYSTRKLLDLVDSHRIPGPLQRVLTMLRLIPANAAREQSGEAAPVPTDLN